jgi:hypothetical protein
MPTLLQLALMLMPTSHFLVLSLGALAGLIAFRWPLRKFFRWPLS